MCVGYVIVYKLKKKIFFINMWS